MTAGPIAQTVPTLLDLPHSTHAVLLTVSGRREFARYAEELYRAAEQPGIPNRQQVRDALAQVLVLLATAEPAAQLPDDGSRIELGERVELTNSDGRRHVLLVDPVEAVLGGDRIDVSSAFGQSLVGRRVGDQITMPDTGRFGVVTAVSRHDV
jgi:transcription elongation GreA/GreB family factor